MIESPTNYKISFCTVCMNRLHHLKRTLPQNIEDNNDYDNLEFIILDYNSQDGMERWMKQHMKGLIKLGKVIYYKTKDPIFFHRSHSRNIAFRLAEGNIICNIDADNFTGKGFAKYVNECFQRKEEIFLTPIDFHKTKRNYSPLSDTLGRVCFKKENFLKINGFDENMITHGFQDFDFANRLELVGVKRVLIQELKFLTAITHGDDERLTNEPDNYDIEYILIRHLDHTKSEILFLYKKGNYERGIITDNKAMACGNYKSGVLTKKIKYEYSLINDKWTEGTWELENNYLQIMDNNTKEVNKFSVSKLQANVEENILVFSQKGKIIFLEIMNPKVIRDLLLFNRQISNRNTMWKNYKLQNIIVNKNGFAKGVVFKNFNILKKIHLS